MYGYPCVETGYEKNLYNAPDHIYEECEFKVLLVGLIHKHSAYDESENGDSYEHESEQEHDRASKTEPCCFGKRDRNVEVYQGKEDRECHGTHKLIFTQQIFR
jgi:hypothetical protein